VATTDVVWLVGRADEIGVLQEHVQDLDVTVEDTWPCGVNADVVVLVRSAADDAEAAGHALGAGVTRFDDAESARRAAIDLASPA